MLKRKMKEVVVRLKRGDLLKESILDICKKEKIEAGVIASSVGSLTKAFIRNAGATEIKELNRDLEILSLNGTVSMNRIHLHICVSDDKLQTYGGHLENGSVINSTCELVILVLDRYEFDKIFDKETGYNELLIKEKKDDKSR